MIRAMWGYVWPIAVVCVAAALLVAVGWQAAYERGHSDGRREAMAGWGCP